MRMLSGDANPFHRSFSPSRLVQSKMKSFRALESRSFKTTYKVKPPETIIAEDFSDSNVSILSSQSLEFCDSNKVSKKEMIMKGKFSGLTLQETLAWRHHISTNVNHPKIVRQKNRDHDMKQESFGKIKVEPIPDFMLARANLKKTNERASKGLIVATKSMCSVTADSTLNSIGIERDSRDQRKPEDDIQSRDEQSYPSYRNRVHDSRDTDVDSFLTPDRQHLISTQKIEDTDKISELKMNHTFIPQCSQLQLEENTSSSAPVQKNDAKAILNAMLLSRKREQSPTVRSNRTQDSTNALDAVLNEKSAHPKPLPIHFNTKNTTADPHDRDRSNTDSKLNFLPLNPFSTSSIPDNCNKYSKMLKMGVPLTAVQNSMIRDGVEPSTLCKNQLNEAENSPQQKKDPFRRTRLHWTPVQNYSQDSIWYQISKDSEFESIPIDEDEFQALFQIKVQPVSSSISRSKDNLHDGIVKVIDAKRANNGGIILAGLRMSFEEIAMAIDLIDESFFTIQQVKGLLEYIPNPKERQALNSFLSNSDDNSISSLSECERFMVSLLPVNHVKEKMEVMLFKLQFPSAVKDYTTVIVTLSKACDEILCSQKLKKLLGTILKIGNHLNHAGVIPKVNDTVAFELDSLAKLKQVKAWDRKTTVLLYISSLIFKWNEPVLSIKDDFPNVLKVLSFNENDYEETLNALIQQMNSVQKIMLDLNIVPTTKFFLDASETLDDLNESSSLLKKKFDEVLDYLAASRSLKPMELFCSLSSFCNDIEKAYSHLKYDKNIKDRSNWRKKLRKYNE